jgi:hypothetical protein
MAGWEPALIDIHGVHWTGPDSYAFYDGTVRYEQYEVNMAAKVTTLSVLWYIDMWYMGGYTLLVGARHSHECACAHGCLQLA